ncbi:DUF4340 domain-containing protein [uncultured Methylophaga sp.]|uniref:DUF4340 domain-containing protein n=1 Tax=uncultured Methylophaga sp. TaxID=285271 RepID=UPI00261B6FD0|nr:DUF4340 domain-containing protein [uncultured Methylophaga sp.]
MKSSYLTNLVLLVIVIVLLWLSQREQPAEQQPAGLSALSAEAVERIQIQRQDRDTLTLERQQQSWQLTQPFNARANQTRVNLLLSLLSSPIHGQQPASDESALLEFGLDQPEVTLLMNEQPFAFGATESLSQNRYVLHRNVVYLVQDDVTPLLKASAGSFVDNRLVEEGVSINKLTLPASNETDEQRLIEQRDGRWHSNNSSASSDGLKTLVDNWQHAYAMQVRHLDADELNSLPSPQISLWLESNSQPLQLIMTLSGETLQLTNPALQLQYEFPLAMRSQLLPQ